MFQQHRQQLLQLLGAEGAAAVLPSGSPVIRNHDCEHRFRPQSDFWYLSGFEEPEAVLVLRPGAEEGGQSVLFLREKKREEEIWTGRRLGSEAAPAKLGVDAAYPLDELWQRLPGLLEGHGKLVYPLGRDEAFDRHLVEVVTGLQKKVRNGALAPTEWLNPVPFVHELRLFKGEAELALMRRAAEITAEAHLAAMAAVAPGVNEAEIDALLDYTFRRRGGTGQAYANIVAGGANACVLHYIENRQELRAGELVLIDAGAEWQYYASDVTRTFPVDGNFRPEQRALYELVLGAQKSAIEMVRPGLRFNEVHDHTVELLTAGLIELGLLEGPLEKAIEEASYKRFYMHKTSHWLGLDVHDAGAYHTGGESRRLEPGMVFTVEPGIYVDPEDEGVEERWRGIGIRIEDDLLVTPEGHEVLTAAIPKEIDELEAACACAALETVG